MSYLGSMSWHYIKSLEVSKIQQLDNFHRKLTVKIGDDFFELDFFSEEKDNLEIKGIHHNEPDRSNEAIPDEKHN